MSVGLVMAPDGPRKAFSAVGCGRPSNAQGRRNSGLSVSTSLVFTAWHLSAIILDTGFQCPTAGSADIPRQRDLAWRWHSRSSGRRTGSVIAASVCHCAWKRARLPFVRFRRIGRRSRNRAKPIFFGPEVGLAGIPTKRARGFPVVAVVATPLTYSGKRDECNSEQYQRWQPRGRMRDSGRTPGRYFASISLIR